MMVVAAFFLLASPSASCSSGGSKELARRLFSSIDFDRAASITIAPSLEGVVLKREEDSPGSSDWHGVDGHEGRYSRVDSDTFKKKAAWQ